MVEQVATPGLRERKRAQARRAIEEAALRLFVEQGFEATTVDQIAEAADVSPRTFFNYFPTKEEVVLGPQRDNYDELGEAIARQPRDVDVLTAISAAVHELARGVRGSDVLARMQTLNNSPTLLGRQAQTRERWAEAIADALARRDRRRTTNRRDRLAAQVAIGVLSAALVEWIAGGGRSDFGALIEDAFADLRAVARS